MMESGIDSVYHAVVGMLDLDSMQNIMAAMIEPHCQPADGVDGENFCFDKFAKSELKSSRFLNLLLLES